MTEVWRLVSHCLIPRASLAPRSLPGRFGTYLTIWLTLVLSKWPGRASCFVSSRSDGQAWYTCLTGPRPCRPILPGRCGAATRAPYSWHRYRRTVTSRIVGRPPNGSCPNHRRLPNPVPGTVRSLVTPARPGRRTWSGHGSQRVSVLALDRVLGSVSRPTLTTERYGEAPGGPRRGSRYASAHVRLFRAPEGAIQPGLH